MPVAEEWFLDKIILPSSVEMQALNAARLEAGITTFAEYGAGEVHPNFLATQRQQPLIPFTTTQLGTMLTNVPLIGASIASATFYLKAGAVTGRVARATTSHKKVACTTACFYWSTIKLSHNGVGTIDGIIVPIYDASNDPFIQTSGIALSGTISSQDYFGAGPVYINGTAYTDIQEITINSGLELFELGGASEVYNTAIGVRKVEPTAEVRLLKAINWATLGLGGVALNGSTGFIAYGRKYSPDGNRIANATAGHVGVSALYGRVIPQNTSGDGSNVLSDTFKVEMRYDSTPGTSMRVSGATKIDGDPLFTNS